uniref:Uncharacterized protein n=1 Tax=Salix viminalis TaxID=40686 RepID=A0A6N2K836_SALVM
MESVGTPVGDQEFLAIRLLESNEKIFTPQLASLGPLHHGKEELKAMEEHNIVFARFSSMEQRNHGGVN